ncbi:uncharacterized protein METZ01_LOCUS242598, partial [marine metagenome]
MALLRPTSRQRFSTQNNLSISKALPVLIS